MQKRNGAVRVRQPWIGLVLATCLGPMLLAATPPRPPNLVFILADDLGYGDVGAYGQTKIRTPHLDRLAAEGMRFTQHYSGNAVCAPSRCVLMTGLHPGHAWVRDNREGRPEGQFALTEGTRTLPRLLQASGYVTGAFGKWGLGGPGTSGDPLRQGFDRFYGYNCQRHAHNYYPTFLWDNDRKVPLDNPDFSPHQRFPAGADPASPESYRAYQGRRYAPDLILEQALRFIRDHQDRPFFLYFPTTVPHLALQVPEDSLAEYRGRWPDPPYLGDRSYLPHPTPLAAYAAMVTRMDAAVGHLLDQLAALRLDRQTLVVFSSDNGPAHGRLGGTDSDFFASAAGLRGRKGSLYEGGIRVPCLARWPGRIRPGTVSSRVSGFEDWLPTLLELSGNQGRIPKGLDGISLAPTLMGKRQKERPLLYREFPGYGGQQSVRVGDWKAVRQGLVPPGNTAQPPVKTELYDLKRDPRESQDRAASEPRRLAQLEALLRSERTVSAAFPIPVLDGGVP